jgi:hypothetical protein
MWCVHLDEIPSHTKVFATECHFTQKAVVSIWFDGAKILIDSCDSSSLLLPFGKTPGD